MLNEERKVEESGATTLFLVRHGETVDNARQIMQGQTQGCLNERGREQAQQVARRLADEPIDAVVASDLQRAIQTAEIIAAPHGLSVSTTLCSVSVIGEALRGVFIPDLKGVVWPDDIESEPKLLQRAADFLQYITTTYPGKRVVAVGHGIMNKAVLAVYAGCTMREVQRMMNAEVRVLTPTAERTAASAAASMTATAVATASKTSAAGAANTTATLPPNEPLLRSPPNEPLLRLPPNEALLRLLLLNEPLLGRLLASRFTVVRVELVRGPPKLSGRW